MTTVPAPTTPWIAPPSILALMEVLAMTGTNGLYLRLRLASRIVLWRAEG
jgi:hypothetical protein